jgi:uncharacterized protein (TIGR02147 family)
MDRIETYTDYRQFLKEYYDEQKRRFTHFSYRYFCIKSGITSSALFKEIVEGKRNLTERTTDAFIKGLGLTDLDANYFRALVHFNQTDNEQEKSLILAQLKGFRRKIKQLPVTVDLYEYYSTWYNPVIRELACIIDWKDDYQFLADILDPPIKKNEAKKAVAFLIDNGFIRKTENGRYLQTNPALTTGSEVVSLAIRTFNEELAKKGVEAIQAHPPTDRDIRTVITGVSRKSYLLVKDEMREFISRVIRIVDDDKEADRVYSLNLQLFPLSKKIHNGESGNECK